MSEASTIQRGDKVPNGHAVPRRSPLPILSIPLPRLPPQQQPSNDTATTTTVKTTSYAQQQLGVSLSDGLKKAYDECKAKVERIAAQCRAKNRKYRDVEFDVENDWDRCLHNLDDHKTFWPCDVRRVPDIFNNPVFYSGTLKSAEVVQGKVEDCYLVSALSTMTSIGGLIKNLCVARDEEVGIYGFLFYRDCYWVPIIIDDLLFTKVPKYEQLSAAEMELYHFEKEKYNATARRGADSLYFAKPVSPGEETWVPLVEKAWAKLHGDYASVMFGRACEAIEDMTGGVSNLILTKDILDRDKFWHEELVKANNDRLFGCWFKTIDTGLPRSSRVVKRNPTVDGLVGNLSYSIVKAVEIKGKRFVVLRDPWGTPGWGGAWSDGSKEWTTEWLDLLPELGHSFGGSGQFVMEYSDFLNVWQEIQRTLIFDDTWVMSSQWLHISQPFPSMASWSYGDINFTFSLPVASPAIIVLSKYDCRYFKDIQGPCFWNVDFILVREGEMEPMAESSYSFFNTRSVNVEFGLLEAGNYIVLARLDPIPIRDKNYFRKGLSSGWNRRKLARILTERAKGQSIAANYKPNPQHLITPLSSLLGGEEAKANKTVTDALHTYGNNVQPGESITVTTTSTTTTVVSKNGGNNNNNKPSNHRTSAHHPHPPPPPHHFSNAPPPPPPPPPLPPLSPFTPIAAAPYYMEPWAGIPLSPRTPLDSPRYTPVDNYYGHYGPYGTLPPAAPLNLGRPMSPPPPPINDVLEDDNSIVVGLRVYTQKSAPTLISGRLKSPGN